VRAGTYYIRARHFNPNHFGAETHYQLAIAAVLPPTPTPTPSPTPTPTPSPTPTVPPAQIKTLILVNRQRLNTLYDVGSVDALMNKLYALANHDRVRGAVIQIETDPAVANAYTQWTGNQSALLDVANANAVASAIRNLTLSFLSGAPNVEYIVLVGSDAVIPYRRVPEGTLSKQEQQYAPHVTGNTPQWAATQNNMILTDDYYADREPTLWQGHEIYLPDYAIGRLVETPDEISAFIDPFLANPTLAATRALVTGYDFVIDAGGAVDTLFRYDSLTTDSALIGVTWTGDALRSRQLAAGNRFDLQSINGHATHAAFGVPDQNDIQASEIAAATGDFARSLVFSVGAIPDSTTTARSIWRRPSRASRPITWATPASDGGAAASSIPRA